MYPLTPEFGIMPPGVSGKLVCLFTSSPVSDWPSEFRADRLFESLGLAPAQAAAALAVHGLEADAGLGPPLMTSKPKMPQFRRFLEAEFWAEALPEAPRAGRLALAAGLLQIFDFWDASHEAAQQAGDLGERPYSACWHAICHRREPDPGNAGYWLSRARHNPVGPRLAEIIESDLDSLDSSIKPVASRLVRNGSFQDKAMVELCCRPRPPDPEHRFLRQVQKFEMAILFAGTLGELF